MMRTIDQKLGRKALAVVVLGAAVALMPSLSWSKADQDQNQIILLNDSAAALEDSNPPLSKQLSAFADEKEKDWEAAKNAGNTPAVPAPLTDQQKAHLRDQVKLLQTASVSIGTVYPLITKGLNDMRQELERTIKGEN